jgi:hypothetical protein
MQNKRGISCFTPRTVAASTMHNSVSPTADGNWGSKKKTRPHRSPLSSRRRLCLPPAPSLPSVYRQHLSSPPPPVGSTASPPSPDGSAPSPSVEARACFKVDKLTQGASHTGGLAHSHLRRWWVATSDAKPAPPPPSMSVPVLLSLLLALPPPHLPHGGARTPPVTADERPPPQLGPLSRAAGCLRGERRCNLVYEPR